MMVGAAAMKDDRNLTRKYDLVSSWVGKIYATAVLVKYSIRIEYL